MSREKAEVIPADYYPEGFAEWLQPLFDARKRFVAGWSDAERSFCLAIIRSFTDTGTGPSLDRLVELSGLEEEEAGQIASRFDKKDVIKYDADSRQVLAFYPFSAVPSPAHMTFPSGRRQFGM